MAKSKLDNIKNYIETLNDPSVTFISAINQGLVIPPNMYSAQQKLQPIPDDPADAGWFHALV